MISALFRGLVGLILCQHAQGYSAADLLRAARGGDTETVQAVLAENKVDTSMKYKEETPLHVAAAGGFIEVARLLLESGVPATVKNFNNTGPIVEAVLGDRADMIELLHRHGADINGNVLKDEVHYPLIIVAAGEGKTAAIAKLLDLGVHVDSRSQPLSGLKHKVGDDTPLIAAGFQGQTGAMKLLLDRGADPSLANRQGNTALHAATFANKPSTLKFLLDRGVFNVSQTNQDGFSPVILAAHAGSDKCLRLLLKAGASVNTPPRIDFNPLIVSVRTYNQPLFKEVMLWSPDVNAYDSVNFTALYHSLSNNHHKMASQLLRKGAALGKQNDYVKGIMDEW
ncbi:unnamed protein product, partial [Ectocarpus fasciculatus]